MNTQPAVAASATEINRDVDAALAKLYADIPDARTLAEKARGVLVFPNVVKAGFLLGAQYGDGALRRQGRTVAYYNTVAASYGLQAGVQSFGYVLFFMTQPARERRKARGAAERLLRGWDRGRSAVRAHARSRREARACQPRAGMR